MYRVLCLSSHPPTTLRGSCILEIGVLKLSDLCNGENLPIVKHQDRIQPRSWLVPQCVISVYMRFSLHSVSHNCTQVLIHVVVVSLIWFCGFHGSEPTLLSAASPVHSQTSRRSVPTNLLEQVPGTSHSHSFMYSVQIPNVFTFIVFFFNL